jgi:hypothetical protein
MTPDKHAGMKPSAMYAKLRPYLNVVVISMRDRPPPRRVLHEDALRAAAPGPGADRTEGYERNERSWPPSWPRRPACAIRRAARARARARGRAGDPRGVGAPGSAERRARRAAARRRCGEAALPAAGAALRALEQYPAQALRRRGAAGPRRGPRAPLVLAPSRAGLPADAAYGVERALRVALEGDVIALGRTRASYSPQESPRPFSQNARPSWKRPCCNDLRVRILRLDRAACTAPLLQIVAYAGLLLAGAQRGRLARALQ